MTTSASGSYVCQPPGVVQRLLPCMGSRGLCHLWPVGGCQQSDYWLMSAELTKWVCQQGLVCLWLVTLPSSLYLLFLLSVTIVFCSSLDEILFLVVCIRMKNVFTPEVNVTLIQDINVMDSTQVFCKSVLTQLKGVKGSELLPYLLV